MIHSADAVTALLASAARADGSGDGGSLTRDGARAAARQELGKATYHRNDPTWRERAFDWVIQHLGHLFSRAGDATPGGWLTIVVAVIAVVALTWALARHVRRGARATRALDDAETTALSAADLRARSDASAAAGRWADAIRERMRAIARSLEERAILAPRPGRTAAEVAAEAGTQLPGAAVALRLAARTFDEVSYGGRVATPQGYALVLDADAAATAVRPAAAGSRNGAGSLAAPQ